MGRPRVKGATDEPLPEDIEQVWGGGKLDSSGMLAADTARFLIGEWGLERFRASALHTAAIGARASLHPDSRKPDTKPERKGRS